MEQQELTAMEQIALLVLAALVVLVLVVVLSSKRSPAQDYERGERRHMPSEIADGKLVLSEQTLYAHRVGLVAKVDQVYLTPDGLLVPVENKTRKRDEVRDYDRAELSVQGMVLRQYRPGNLRRAKVADYGYVAVRLDGHEPRWHKVKLGDDAVVLALRDRRLALEAGKVKPNGPVSDWICRTCAQAARCPML